VIMYGGRPMEKADVRSAFTEPHHPYTQGLLQSIPSYAGRQARLQPIKGYPPSVMRLVDECPFANRCPYVHDECRARAPELKKVGQGAGHVSACVLPSDRVGIADQPSAASVASALGPS
jgi:peptide/nickel transport system ATP-binding protein